MVADEPCVAEAIERGELDADDGVRLCVDVGCLGDPTIHDPPTPPPPTTHPSRARIGVKNNLRSRERRSWWGESVLEESCPPSAGPGPELAQLSSSSFSPNSDDAMCPCRALRARRWCEKNTMRALGAGGAGERYESPHGSAAGEGRLGDVAEHGEELQVVGRLLEDAAALGRLGQLTVQMRRNDYVLGQILGALVSGTRHDTHNTTQ